MGSPDIQIEVGDERTPDVDAGFRLYAQYTSGLLDPATFREWLYWYDQNPFGKGVYAVAKSGDEVVGFYSMIPAEMRIEGQLVKGAKGECFVVAPGFRKTSYGPRGMKLPLALSAELHSAAAGFGMVCLFLVGTPAAAFCHAMSGAKTIRYDAEEFVIPFGTAGGGTLKSRCKTFLKARYVAVRRGVAAIRRIGRSRGGFEMGGISGETPGRSGDNLLVSDGGKMLGYRFPEARYLIYSVPDVHDDRAFLVFSAPRCGGSVSLKHWSPQRIPVENAAAVLKDVIRRCRRVKAASVSMVVPSSDKDIIGTIGQLGLLQRRSTASVQIYPSAKEPAAASLSWRFTNSHQGWFGFA